MQQQTERPARASAYGVIPCAGRIPDMETPAVAHLASALEHVRSAVKHAGLPQDDPEFIPDNVSLIVDELERVLDQAGVRRTPEPTVWQRVLAAFLGAGRRRTWRASRLSDDPQSNYTP